MGFRSPSSPRLDTTGLYCPVPVLRTRDRLKRLAPGAELEILADDPQVLEDLPAFCARHGHEYLGHRVEEGGVFVLRVRKGWACLPARGGRVL